METQSAKNKGSEAHAHAAQCPDLGVLLLVSKAAVPSVRRRLLSKELRRE